VIQLGLDSINDHVRELGGQVYEGEAPFLLRIQDTNSGLYVAVPTEDIKVKILNLVSS